jgi:hypothetical protein
MIQRLTFGGEFRTTMLDPVLVNGGARLETLIFRDLFIWGIIRSLAQLNVSI